MLPGEALFAEGAPPLDCELLHRNVTNLTQWSCLGADTAHSLRWRKFLTRRSPARGREGAGRGELEARTRQYDVRVAPRGAKPRFRLLRVESLVALRARQCRERPSILRVMREILAQDALGLGGASGLEQHRAQRVSRRGEPEVRLVVGEAVLPQPRGFAETVDGTRRGSPRRARSRPERGARDRGKARSGVDVLHLRLLEARILRRRQAPEFLPGARRLPRARPRGAAREMEDDERIGLGGVGRQRAQDLFPAGEPHERVEVQRRLVLQGRGGEVVRARAAGDGVGLLRRGDRDRAAAFHRRGRPQEVQIVRDVADAVGALRVHLREVGAVRCDRALVGGEASA